MIKENIRKVYKIGKPLGAGKFGSVRIGIPFNNQTKKFAIKSIRKEVDEDYIRQLEKEFRILLEVDHPNIIKFYETYQDQKYFHFVMELWDGGELFDRVNKGHLDESEVVIIIKKLCSAIAHLHDKEICHRDLKPENILFENKSPNAEIKLIDFGLSTYARSNREMRTRVGTPFYVAPEVLEGKYQKSCDMWSIGVIAYLLWAGYPPFYDDDNEVIYDLIEKAEFEYVTEDWIGISHFAKDFINKLLLKDADKRMTPLQALQHGWLKSYSIPGKIHHEVITRLKSFEAPRKLQTEVLLLLSSYMSQDELQKIRETFEAIDVDYSGWISIDELKQALKDKEDEETIQRIMDNIDFDRNGEINYSEFLAATIDSKLINSKDNIETVFKHFDINKQGVITPETLRHVFKRGCKSFTSNEVEDMIYEATGKHEISLTDFKKIFHK